MTGINIAANFYLILAKAAFITMKRVNTLVSDFIEWDDNQRIKRLDELPEIREWEKKENELLREMKNQAVIGPLGILSTMRSIVVTILRALVLVVVFLAGVLISVSAVGEESPRWNVGGIDGKLTSFPFPQPKPPFPDPFPPPDPLPLPRPDCPGPGCPALAS